MTASRTRLVALLWLLAMSAIVLGVWASIFIVPGATTWFEAGAFLATNLILTTVVVRGSTIEVAISTLVVAVLFQPLRRTVQRQIDRRFNRSHIGTEAMVARFLARTREEVDLERLSDETRLAAAGGVQPTSIRVWLRQGGGG